MSNDFDPRQELAEAKHSLVIDLKDRLDGCVPGDEVYFHDIVHELVDMRAAYWSRQECLKIIDYTGNERHVDKGLVQFDKGLNKLLATMAFECFRIELFNDERIQELQEKFNNVKFEDEEAIENRMEMLEELEETYDDLRGE